MRGGRAKSFFIESSTSSVSSFCLFPMAVSAHQSSVRRRYALAHTASVRFCPLLTTACRCTTRILLLCCCIFCCARRFPLAIRRTPARHFRLLGLFPHFSFLCKKRRTTCSVRLRLSKKFFSEKLHKSFRPPFLKGGVSRGRALAASRRTRNPLLFKAQEGRKTSRRDVFRWGTLAGGSPRWRSVAA